MKIILNILFIMFIFSCSATTKINSTDQYEPLRNYQPEKNLGPKKKLAVTKFINATRFGDRRLGDNISDILVTELSKTERFILLEREKVDQIFEEHALSQTGFTDGTLEQINLMDADFVITGTVTGYSVKTTGESGIFTSNKKQKAEVTVDLRIISVVNGEIILAETGRGIAEKMHEQFMGVGESGGYDESLEMQAFRVAIISLIEKIINATDQFPWTCNVVNISDNKLYIDAGRKSNIKIGDTLNIYQRGKMITGLNGKLLGYEETLLDNGIVIDFLGDDGAVILPNSAKEFQLPLIIRIDSRNR